MTAPHALPAAGPGAPTPAIALRDGGAAATAHLDAAFVPVPPAVIARLAAISPTITDGDALGEASRDWWPQAMIWALEGQVAARAGAVVSPTSAAEVAAVLAVCDDARVPVTAAAGRSGVCGASVPVHGGVVLDLCGLTGIVDVDTTSLVLDVAPGTFGDHLEHALRTDHGLTLGHWPQSVALSTVGGWLACRSAGQLSTRYGKIEDMVLGLDVALADGRQISTGGAPRAAVGPDLNQLFVGSEGTLGIITGARLRLHPAPTHERRAAYGFASFAEGIDAMRRILQRGGTPAVLRLYDPAEADRTYKTGDRALLLVLDEGDVAAVDGTMELVAHTCRDAHHEDVEHVAHWLEHRNDVAALEALISRGYVVDTMEVVGRWRDLPGIYDATIARPQRRRGHAVGLGAPVAQLHRRRLPLLHLRRQGGGRRPRPLLPRRVGRRQPGRPRRGWRAVPPPRRGPEPQSVRGGGARPGLRGPHRHEDRPGPQRDLEPGEARARVALRGHGVLRAR